MKIQFGSLFSFFPPQFVHFHPLKVISDLWVSFPGRMIAVFYGGGERSTAPHQGWCPLENDWAGRADRSTAVPLQIQAVALHHRQEDDSLYLSLASSFPSLLPLSFIPLAPLSQGTVAFSQFLPGTDTHTRADTHAIYLSKTPLLPAPNPPPQRNSFQLCGLLKKPLYAELT